MKKLPIAVNEQRIKAMLPDMPESFGNEMCDLIEDISHREKEKPMKRKISIGLVFALVILLFVMGAVAAVVLSGKQFVGEVLAPKVTETTSNRWTQEELDEILRVANEYGVELTDDVRERLEKADGEYKEELMRAFAKTELGFYPATWSIEDQAWYDKLLVQCGLMDFQTRFVPEGDEILEEQALSVATTYIRDVYQDDMDVTDGGVYRRFVEYRQFVDRDNTISPKKWYITYEALDLSHSSYHFTLLTDGTVEEARCEPGISAQGEMTITPVGVLTRYRDVFGYDTDWTAEIWIAFHKDLSRSAEAFSDEVTAGLSCILQQEYVLPDTQTLPKQKAFDAAATQMVAQGLATQQEIDADWEPFAILLMDGETPVWKVMLRKDNPEGGFSSFLAEVDAKTAEVKNTANIKKNGPWYEPYVLERTLQELEERSVG